MDYDGIQKKEVITGRTRQDVANIRKGDDFMIEPSVKPYESMLTK
jgi:hypothetical protein